MVKGNDDGYEQQAREQRGALLAAWDFDTASVVKARICRQEFREVLRMYGDPSGDLDGAELIFGELLGNVVRHAPGRITIRLEWDRIFPTLVVHDEEEVFAVACDLPTDPLHESGRGMFIISRLAVSLKVEDVPNDGTKVIVELPVLKAVR
jgi:anti-sigma regulatory factor (Ser/Thr protein kinase)